MSPIQRLTGVGTLAVLAMIAALVPSPALASAPGWNTIWTLPYAPRAGQPFRLVGFASLTGDGVFDWTATQVEVSGGQIDVQLSWTCPNPFLCDYSETRPVQIEIPPLAAGEYAVRIHQYPDQEFPALEATLVVADGEPGASIRNPVNGWWWDPERPGYGLIVDRRGDFLGLSLFDGAGWSIATGPVIEDRFVAVEQYFALGSCAYAGCDEPYAAPITGFGYEAVNIEFLSAREAQVQFRSGDSRRLVAMPVGGGYRSDFGMPEETARLPLPDLRGTWVFTVDPVARETYWVESQAPLTIRFETLELDPENEAPEVDLAWRGVDPSGVEAGSREYSLICRSGTPSACSLRYDGLQGLPPPSPLRQWHATLDNIAQDRIEATWGEGDHLVRVRGFRVD